MIKLSRRDFIQLSLSVLSLPRLSVGESPATACTLVQNGQSDATIVLPEQPTASESEAGQELQKHLAEISGATLPVERETGQYDKTQSVVAVGKTSWAQQLGLTEELKAVPGDGFIIRCLPEKRLLLLVGKTEAGQLFAVNHFLEQQCGVHWYMPDDLGRVLPKKKTIAVGRLDEVHRPDFRMRWVGDQRVRRWALFNKSNTNVDDRIGLRVNKPAHTFDDFLPPERYFKSHPEYFALVNGKRTPPQLNTSHPEVINIVSTNAIKLLDTNPHLDLITVFPPDGSKFCEDKACKELDEPGMPSVEEINTKWRDLGPERFRAMSRRMTIFYRQVAQRILAKHPKIIVQVGAYNSYLYPPKDTTLKAPENVMVEMCHSWCHNHPIESQTCEINTRFRQAMVGWKNIYSGLTIYEYYRKGAQLDLPFPILHAIKKDIPFFKSHNVFGLYTQFSHDYYTNGLNYYLASKLLWNSQGNADSILDDFYKNFYGKSWSHMKSYWENYENAAIDADIHLSSPVYNMDLLFTENLIKNQRDALNKALSSAESGLIKNRIEKSVTSLEYVILCMEYVKTAKESFSKKGKVEDAKAGAAKRAEGGKARHAERDKARRAERDNEERLENMAKKIMELRERNEQSQAFGGNPTYIQRFLNPKWVARQIEEESAGFPMPDSSD